MSERATLIACILVTALASCSHTVRTQLDATARVDSGAALNERAATYTVSGVDVRLETVVALPGEELGLGFSFANAERGCCSLFPRIALVGAPTSSSSGPTVVVIPGSAVADDGSLAMRLFDGAGPTVPFSIDLRALGVPLP